MSDSVTIARPYAKAIFEYACNAGELRQWSEYLRNLAWVVLDQDAVSFIKNPATTSKQHIELLTSIADNKALAKDKDYFNNLIKVLAENKRLMVLPDIFTLFEAMRAEQEKILTARVTSYSELTSAQQQKLINTLSERLKRQVTLEITIDKTLIGGAIINAGDLVIDGSVRGKLDKLNTSLAA